MSFYMNNWWCSKVPHIITILRDFIKSVKSFIKSLFVFLNRCRRFIKLWRKLILLVKGFSLRRGSVVGGGEV